MNEAVNDTAKLLAQALESINKYIAYEGAIMSNSCYVYHTKELIEQALDKLATNI